MKKFLIVCILATCCSFAFAATENGTVANMPIKAATPTVAAPSVDLGHVTMEKALAYIKAQKMNRLLDLNDPLYLWAIEQSRTSAPGNRGSLDQGADGCPGTAIAALPFTDSGSTAGLTNDAAGCGGWETASDVIYSYTATSNTFHHADLCGSTYDTELSVWTDGCLVTMVGCNDDSQCGLQSSLDWCATAGVTYYIVVDGYGSNSGDYTLNVSDTGVDCAPPVYGRCCYNSGTACVDGITEDECWAGFGSTDWVANETCTTLPCVVPPCNVDYVVTAPVAHSGNTCGATDNCAVVSDGDYVYEVTIPNNGNWNIWLCDESVSFWDSYMCLGTTCCGSEIICRDDGGCGGSNYYLSKIDCLPLTAGVYYLSVGGLYGGQCGGYTLQIFECPPPPPTGACCYQNSCYNGYSQADCEGFGGTYQGDLTTCASNPCPPPPPPPGALRVINVPVPSSLGVSISADCRGDLYYTNYGEGILHRMDEWGALISSTPILDASGAQRFIDELGWDESRQVFWGGELNTNAVWTVDRNGLAVYQFPGQAGIGLTDGLDYDGTDGTIWHSTDVSADIAHFSSTGLLLGSLTLLDENGNPEGTISGVELGASNTIWAGNSPIDDVRRCNKTTGAFVSRFDAGQVRCEGMECDAINFAPQTVLWVKDAYNNTVTAFEIEAGTCVCAELPDTCQFPYEEVDHGDLAACNYPTLVNNPAHGLSGVAWLGPLVDGEAAPEILNADQLPEDDGVFFVGLPWTPCTVEDLRVIVTAGPEYGRYAECGGRLYLNAWKDGNYDGDFCDEIECGPALASEWLIHDVLVTPGAHSFSVLDPGVLDLGVYDGVFRFRLTSTPVGRYGFGLAVVGACAEQCGTFAFDFLGEVEDYIIPDGQLDVELSSFELVPGNSRVTMNWSTASETDNHHFVVLRDGLQMAEITSQGNSAAGFDYSWVDANVNNGTAYSYSLVAVDVNGAQEVLRTESATPRADGGVVTEYALHQNYPNPFNPSTSIRYDLLESGFTTLKVYNIQGQEVATLVNGVQSAGTHTLTFDATGLPSGLYVYRLEANGFVAEQKMLMLK